MRKTYLLFFFFFIAFELFSQNLEKIKHNEVLFINSENQNGDFFKKIKISKNEKKDAFWYEYYFNDGLIIKFSFHEFLDFDKKEKGKPALFFLINRTFIHKNKDIIITKHFMHKIGYPKSIELFRNAKTILLIEENPNHKKQIIVKEVKLFEIGIE